MTERSDEFRREVRAFVDANLPADWQGLGALPHDEADAWLERWRRKMYEAGLLAVSWPVEYGGRGLGSEENIVLAEELARARVPDGAERDRFGIKMLGNTLLRWGTEEQKQRFLPRALSGEDWWCQGYSEPAAGSDLAGVGLRAELDGDHWVLNGQKLWTSFAHRADWVFLLVRTDPTVVKHAGITFLLCPLDQPGIECRQIKTITGHAEFNEVFFTDAVTPADMVVGEVGGGWAVANTLLGFERGEIAASVPLKFREELDRLTNLARERGVAGHPTVRQRLARAHAEVEILRWLSTRALEPMLRGEQPGPVGSLLKVFWSEYHQRATELALDLLGPEALTPAGPLRRTMVRADDPGAPNTNGSWVGTFLVSRGGSIYAGTSQVQRNIIGEQVLGLPREPRADGGPWSQTPR